MERCAPLLRALALAQHRLCGHGAPRARPAPAAAAPAPPAEVGAPATAAAAAAAAGAPGGQSVCTAAAPPPPPAPAPPEPAAAAVAAGGGSGTAAVHGWPPETIRAGGAAASGPAAPVRPPAPLEGAARVAAAQGGADACKGGSPFRLAPPPPPAAVCAVGAAAPVAAITFIETLKEERAPDKACGTAEREEEVLNVMGTMEGNDEESLLGQHDQSADGDSQVLGRVAADGVDSPSGSEDEGALQRGMLPPPPSLLGLATAPESASKDPQSSQAPIKVARVPASCQVVPNGTIILGSSGTQEKAPPAADFAPNSNASTPASAQANRVAGTGPQAAGAQPPQASPNEVVCQVVTLLDKFFADEQAWRRVQQEVGDWERLTALIDRDRPAAQARGRPFRVQVPKPYPGVQYRRSKNLEDRYQRYAKHGDTVQGVIEDDGEWLRTSSNAFLPMRVGTIQILEPVPAEGLPAPPGGGHKSPCCSCEPSAQGSGASPRGGAGASGRSGGAEVVVHTEGRLKGPEGLKAPAPWERGGTDGIAEAARAPPEKGSQPTRHAARPEAGPGPLKEDAVPRAMEGFREAECRRAAAPHTAILREAARRALPEAICRHPLANVDEANRHLSMNLNPFSNGPSPRGGSSESPLRSRPAALLA